MILRLITAVFLINLGFIGFPQTVFGQETTTGTALVTVVSPIADAREKLDAEEKAVTQAGENADTRKRDLLRQNLEALESAQKATSQTLAYRKQISDAPAELRKLRRELSTPNRIPMPEISDTENYLELGLITDQAKSSVTVIQKRRDDYRIENERRSKRAQEISKQIRDIGQQIDELKKVTPPADDPADLAALRKQALDNRIRALELNRDMLREEARFYETDERLQDVRLDIAARELLQATAISENLQRAYERRRELERNQAIRNARQVVQLAEKTDPLVLSLANDITTSIEQRRDPDSAYNKNFRAVQELEAVKSTLETVTEQFDNIKAKVETLESRIHTVNMNDSIGSLLRQQLRNLPSVRDHRIRLENLKPELASAELRLWDFQEAKSKFNDPDQLVEKTISSNTHKTSLTKEQLSMEVRQLFEAHRALIDNSINEYQTYVTTLQQTAENEEILISKLDEFRAFIDERILWIPSTQPLKYSDLTEAFLPINRLINKDNLTGIWNSFQQDFSEAKTLYIITFSVLIIVLYFKLGLRGKLNGILEKARVSRLVAFRPVLEAIALSVCFSLLLPALLFFAGWRLSYSPTAPLWNLAIGTALIHTAFNLMFLLILQRLSRKNGVFETFFEWPDSILKRLRHALYIVTWLWAPATFVIAYCETYNSGLPDEICSRLTLIGTQIVTAVFSFYLWNSKNGILYGILARNKSSWIYYFRLPILVASVGIPLALAIATGLGYHYTAMQLSQRIGSTVWLALLLIIVNEVIFFWILVKRRRLAIEEAKKRREAARLAQQGDSEQSAANELPVVVTEPALDISAISVQAGRILKIIIISVFFMLTWLVWQDIFPALRVLDRQEFQLWEVQSKISTVITAEDGTKSVKVSDALVPISLFDLFQSLAALFITIIAVRNIPGLMEITLLQKLSIGAGEKYALKSIVSYVIIVAGTILSANFLGLQWSSIQWLAAAVSVGLGFGLQDIFSNFVSGLILLFERPVRVGDVVTVGQVTGKISQIKIRATTIMNWDHKEHILPNKALITGEVQNWTLSDRMVRLSLIIPVKDGQDIDEIQDILVAAARETKNVLKEPTPVAELNKFGEFTLYVFLSAPEDMGDVRHDILKEIDVRFKNEGIER